MKDDGIMITIEKVCFAVFFLLYLYFNYEPSQNCIDFIWCMFFVFTPEKKKTYNSQENRENIQISGML